MIQRQHSIGWTRSLVAFLTKLFKFCYCCYWFHMNARMHGTNYISLTLLSSAFSKRNLPFAMLHISIQLLQRTECEKKNREMMTVSLFIVAQLMIFSHRNVCSYLNINRVCVHHKIEIEKKKAFFFIFFLYVIFLIKFVCSASILT